MYKVQKSLGNNALLAIDSESNQQYLILGKGIGFGKRVTQRIEIGEQDTAYCLENKNSKIDMTDIVKSVDSNILEFSDVILKEAENKFGHIDKDILFPLADHISFAIRRLRKGETIHNPMIQDIKMLFYQEFKIASLIQPMIKKQYNIEMNEDEVGYVTLHIHSALTKESVSETAMLAQSVGLCVKKIEEYTGKKINTMSFSYNRLMNHIRYMMLRVRLEEHISLDMNDYMKENALEYFQLSSKICQNIEEEFKCKLDKSEVGYLAIHIQRILIELK